VIGTLLADLNVADLSIVIMTKFLLLFPPRLSTTKEHTGRAVRPDTALCAEKIVGGAGGGRGVEVAAAHNTKKRKMRHNSSQPPHY